jgi:hypothetical protein
LGTATPDSWPPPEPELPSDRKLLAAPTRYEHVILRVSYPVDEQFKNLRYEGHNGLLMAGAADGTEVAQRWRHLVAGSRGVFVLRDSLWSQQDHAYHRVPHALMMPPSWVTVAVDATIARRSIEPLRAPDPNDDDAWAAIAAPGDMFGSFPPSDTLHREAVRARGSDGEARRRTEAARAALRSLAADVSAMLSVVARGAEQVAQVGAARIAASDRAYFTGPLRFHRVIPIFVENPNTKELQEEGKGMTVVGRSLSDQALTLARDAVYRRRLRDGDLALERYDLSQAAERARAIVVLEALIGPDPQAPATTLWLWVTGRLDPHRKAEGENATRYLPAFQRELEKARIDPKRLRIVSMPSTEVPPTDRAAFFTKDADWYRKRDLPYSVRLTTSELRQILGQ